MNLDAQFPAGRARAAVKFEADLLVEPDLELRPLRDLGEGRPLRVPEPAFLSWSGLGSDLPPAGLAQPVDAEDQQAERGKQHQVLAERLIAQGQQRLVDAA